MKYNSGNRLSHLERTSVGVCYNWKEKECVYSRKQSCAVRPQSKPLKGYVA